MKKIELHKPPYGTAIVFAGLTVLILIAYSNSFKVPWHYDDKTNILDNAWIQIRSLSWSELYGAMSGQLSGVLRQASYLGFALNYYFAAKLFGHGLNPLPWHIVNTILHILTSYMVFLLSFDVLKRSRPQWDEKWRFGISATTALFFALNPIQTQTVTYIVQRLAGASAFWYLLTLYLYIKHRTSEKKPIPFLGNFPLLVWSGFIWFSLYYIWKNLLNQQSGIQGMLICLAILAVIEIPLIFFLNRKNLIKRRDGDIYLVLAILTGLITLFTKENSITLPFFCWLYDYLFISGNEESFKNRSIVGWGFVATFLLLLSPILWDKILDTYKDREFTLPERVLTQFRVVWSYLFKMLYPNPNRLNLDIELVNSTSPINPPQTLIAIMTWFGAVGGSIWYLRKDRLIPFLILWYFGQLVIESSFIGLEMAYEHRFYLPGWAPFLLLAMAVFYVFDYLTKKVLTLANPQTGQVFAITVFLVLTSALSIFWTIERNYVWADEILLWRDVVTKSPGKARPKVNLGFLLEQQSEVMMEQAGYATTKTQFDKLQEQVIKNYDEAEELYEKAIKLEPESVYALVNMGHLYLSKGEFAKALEIFHRAEIIKPDDPVLQFNMGVSYKSMGQTEPAREHYQKAIKLRDGYYEALNNLGILEVDDNNVNKAIEYFTEATQVSREPSLAYYNLGTAYIRLNELGKAREAYETCLKFNPDYLKAKVNLANVVSMAQDYDEAIRLYSEVLKQDPNHLSSHYNLGKIYLLQMHDLSNARYHFELLLKLDPNFARRSEVENYLRQIQGGS